MRVGSAFGTGPERLHTWRLFRAWLLLAAVVVLALGSAGRAQMPRNARERVSPHFVLYFEPGKAGDAEAVKLAAEDTFRDISATLRFTPEGRIPIYIYSRRIDFMNNSGVGRTEFVVGTASSADNSIRLDGTEVLAAASHVVKHEVAHVFLFEMLGPHVNRLPLWLHEGLAQQLGGEDPRRASATVVAALYEERLPPLTSLRDEFPPSKRGDLTYAQAQHAVGALLERGGWDAMLRLLNDLKAGITYEEAFNAAYGMSVERWDDVWMGSLRADARRQSWLRFASWVVPILMFIALGWGTLTVRGKRRRQVQEEEPVAELEPPSWWREDEFKR